MTAQEKKQSECSMKVEPESENAATNYRTPRFVVYALRAALTSLSTMFVGYSANYKSTVCSYQPSRLMSTYIPGVFLSISCI